MTRYGHSPHSSMQHLNGNLLASVDVETTGLISGKHDLIQLCVLPLDAEIKPLQSVMPFYLPMIVPKRPETADKHAMRCNHIDMAKLMIQGIDPWKAVDMFEEWFGRLNLPVGKKIVPLGTNYVFDRGFIIDWIGQLSYEAFFDYHFRDTMTAALYLNDRADHHNEKVTFPLVSLNYCCNILKVTNETAHNALSDCVATAEVYRRMLRVPMM